MDLFHFLVLCFTANIFGPCDTGIFVPQTGVEPMSLALKAQGLNHCVTGEGSVA